MTHFYYVKVPISGSENIYEVVDGYADAMIHGFPPEQAVLYVEVTGIRSVSERLKNLIDGLQGDEHLEVPEASMITNDVEEFVRIQDQLQALGVKLSITASQNH